MKEKGLRHRSKIPDIGFGWGGMPICFARRMDLRILGIKLSEERLGCVTKIYVFPIRQQTPR